MKKNTILALVLSILLSLFPLQKTVYAEGADMDKFKKSIETVKTSTENLKDILSQDTDIKAIIDTFDTFSGAVSTIISAGDVIGSVVSFLQLIGVIKGPTAIMNDINVQVNEINTKMNEMQTTLNNITNQMSTMAATSEFRDRYTQAILMGQNWSSYKTGYEEKMSDRINDTYKGLLTSGIRLWFEADTGRESGNNKSDTNQVIVWYKYEDGKYVFKNTYANSFDSSQNRSDVSVPSPFVIYNDEFDAQNDKYLIIDSNFLPRVGLIVYDANNYRTNLINHIKSRIETFVLNNDYSKFIMHNYTNEEIAALTDEEITKIAEDAVDALIYRVIYNVINHNNTFAHGSINDFKKFCEHLLSNQQGVDAMLKWLYLTHAFQFQIKDDINNFIDSMILKVGMYGMFLTDTVFLSKAITDAERNEVINLFSDTIEKLETIKKNAIFKNYDNYSYITNTVIYLGEIEFHGSVNVDWSTRGTYASYRGASDGAINHRTTRDEVLYDMPDQYLLGDVNALVLAYTLQSNGITFNYDFMKNNLLFLDNHPIPDKGVVVTSLNGQKTMNDSTYLKLNSFNILGGYFEGNPSFYLNNLPGKSEMEYFQIRNMATGTVFDTERATLYIDKPLLGIGAYGEDHGYWIVDECAVFSGASTQHYSYENEEKYTGTDFIGNTFKTTTHNAHSVYNCLLSVPERRPPANEIDPLGSFESFVSNKLTSNGGEEHKHEWTNPTQQNIDGVDIINYECENGIHRYSELFSDEDYIELTFELDGGTLNGTTDKYIVLTNDNKKIALPKAPIKQGYEFVSWDGYKATEEYQVNGTKTFKAIYKPSPLYYFVEGENIKMNIDNIGDAKYHIKRSNLDDETILHFNSLNIKNTNVPLSNSKIEEGSLVLTLSKDYIKNLGVGKHTVTFNFDETSISTTLEITTNKRNVPNTKAK